jgi:tetratricopeptide (TPR) repeat protein
MVRAHAKGDLVVSVILDSLRRARGGATPASASARPPMPRPVPEGLTQPGTRKIRASTPRLRPAVVLVVIVMGVGILAAVKLSLGIMERQQASEAQRRIADAARPADEPRAETATINPQRRLIEAIAEQVPGGLPLPKETTLDSLAPSSKAAAPEAPPVAAATPVPSPTEKAAAVEPARTPPSRPRPPAPRAPAPLAAPALPTLPLAVATPPPAEPGNPFELAKQYHKMGRFEDALVHYRAAIARDEFLLAARNNLGLLFHERGLLNEAIEQLTYATRADPNYAAAHKNLGVVYMDAGRLELARAELTVASKLDPKDADALMNLGLVEMKAGKPEVGKEWLLRALRLDSRHALSHYNLGFLYEQSGEIARARQHYSSFVEYASPEYANEIVNVQARIDTLTPQLIPAGR